MNISTKLKSVLLGDGDPQKPLMVVLHGRGDSPAGYEWLPSALNIPELSYLLLQAPDDYFDGYSWYDLPPDQLPGIQRSRILLEETLNALIEAGYSAERIFLFGFSQGCLMTLEFGSRYPHRLGGYIGISGYCYDENAIVHEAPEHIKKAKWLITHGAEDDVLPVERTRAQMQVLQENGFNLKYIEYKKAHTIDEDQELSFLREWIKELIRPIL